MYSNLDNIFENLNVVGAYTADETSGLIARTIFRLPNELQQRVTDEIIFICIEDSFGFYCRYSLSIFQNKDLFHFIILNLSLLNDEDEKMFTIAHEIAHYTLHHYENNQEIIEDRNIEVEADNLVEQWGFIIPERRKN